MMGRGEGNRTNKRSQQGGCGAARGNNDGRLWTTHFLDGVDFFNGTVE
jgi:hypothetical protein